MASERLCERQATGAIAKIGVGGLEMSRFGVVYIAANADRLEVGTQLVSPLNLDHIQMIDMARLIGWDT
jgi:hypothetical protein